LLQAPIENKTHHIHKYPKNYSKAI